LSCQLNITVKHSYQMRQTLGHNPSSTKASIGDYCRTNQDGDHASARNHHGYTAYCRSGFTTLSLVPLPEQYRYGSFVGGAQIARGVGYPGIRWTRRFTWFGPPERNTLRPRVKGVVLLCLSARLRSSLFSPSVRACGVPPEFVPCDCRLPGPFIAQGRAVTG
jgi:hypothetical protein